jgi:hypothetical protein
MLPGILNRNRWQRRAAAGTVLGALMSGGLAAAADAAHRVTTDTPINHLIVFIGENRTFDHIFATYQPSKVNRSPTFFLRASFFRRAFRDRIIIAERTSAMGLGRVRTPGRNDAPHSVDEQPVPAQSPWRTAISLTFHTLCLTYAP